MSSTFAALGVPAKLVSVLDGRAITVPTAIQEATLADSLAGRDLCGRAPTGSGKTLAFGLPLVLRTNKGQPRRPTGLVLVPTRELAAQVQKDLTALAAACDKRILAVYGGTSYVPQRRSLSRGVDILIACPGRLADLVTQGDCDLSNVNVVVVDEADRMADMGFLPEVKRLLDRTSANRQTLLFSATLDGDVDALVRRYQHEPKRFEIEQNDEQRADVKHLFWSAERGDRVRVTAGLVKDHERAIVFCRTRHGADRLTRQLGQAGIEAVAIHGSRTQPQRDRALAAFHSGQAQALIATDVAARGIHVDSVPVVVHFDPPADHKDYLHRSGRTGRAGATGTVVSLVGDDNRSAVRALQRKLGLSSAVDAPSGSHASSGGTGAGSSGGSAAPGTTTLSRRQAAKARPTIDSWGEGSRRPGRERGLGHRSAKRG